MDNNYQQPNPYNTNPGYPQQPVPQPTVAPEAPAQANPYATTAPAQANPYATTAPAQANPYATQVPETPAYADPYATTAPEAPAYADPYATTAPAYADPYGTPAPAPKKSNKGLLIGLIAGGVVLIGIIVAVLLYFNSDSYKYGQAKDLMAEGKYDEAIVVFNELGNYKDSSDLADECNYNKATALMDDENYEEALAIFKNLDSSEYSDKHIECGRKALYAYLEESGENVYYFPGSGSYVATIDDGELVFWYLENDDDSFKLSLDMTSDTADFAYIWDAYYSDDSISLGDCVVSELTTYGNDLTIDSYTGLYLPHTTNSCCDNLCSNLAGLLEETGLDITPEDLGFTGIE